MGNIHTCSKYEARSVLVIWNEDVDLSQKMQIVYRVGEENEADNVLFAISELEIFCNVQQTLR